MMNMDLQVCDIISNLGELNWNLLCQVVNENTENAVNKLKSSNRDLHDQYIRARSKTGFFSLKSAYKIAVREQHDIGEVP